MSATLTEREAIIRTGIREQSRRKPNPADLRTIFIGRLADKWKAVGTMEKTIAWVVSDMQFLFGLSPSTIRTLCRNQIARLMLAGDVKGRADVRAVLSEANRVGITPRWIKP